MVDYNPLPSKLYRQLLSKIYQQTQKDAKLIKDNFSKNRNPICPKESRCLSSKTRSYNLTQNYLKKMEEKPEKFHKKRIPVEKHLNRNLSVIPKERNNTNIKMFRNIRKNQTSLSMPKYESHTKFISKKDNYKNFYFDYFNSKKINQLDLITKKSVRLFIYFIIK